MTLKPRDLGLSYEEAAHGIQTAVLHEMNVREKELSQELTIRNGGATMTPDPVSLRIHDRHPNGPKHLNIAPVDIGKSTSKEAHMTDECAMVLRVLTRSIALTVLWLACCASMASIDPTGRPGEGVPAHDRR
jgi:hypothetical protein